MFCFFFFFFSRVLYKTLYCAMPTRLLSQYSYLAISKEDNVVIYTSPLPAAHKTHTHTPYCHRRLLTTTRGTSTRHFASVL
uniref:Putative secreted protein n=1 Tax=Rhipicephalus microplus TaxID=6941 RepID=A0A6M2DDJ1_RHIMP